MNKCQKSILLLIVLFVMAMWVLYISRESPVWVPTATRGETPQENFDIETQAPISGRYDAWHGGEEYAKINAKGHTRRVNSVDYSPNGDWIVTGSDDNTAKIWDTHTGSVKRTLTGHGDGVSAVAVSPDGQFIATGSKDGTARIWNTQSGEVEHDLQKHTEWIWCIDYSPNGAYVATAGMDQKTKIWNAKTGSLDWDLNTPGQWNYSCAFSPDSKKIVVGYPALVVLWDFQRARQDLSFLIGKHENYIQAVAYAPDGESITAAGLQKTTEIWDTKSGQRIHKLIGHEGYVTGIDYSPDGRLIATAGDFTVRLWTAGTGELYQTFKCPTEVTDVVFSPDGRRLAVALYDKAVLFDAETGKPLKEFRGEP